MKKAAATAAKPPARRSARTARNATTTKVTAHSNSGRSVDVPPTIYNVSILWRENGVVPTKSYPSLWDADVALARVFHQMPPSVEFIEVGFRVDWTDGEIHEGRFVVDDETMREERGAGLLRTHLVEHARWIGSESFQRMFAGRGPTYEFEQKRRWGAELLRRIERDTRSHDDLNAIRNGSSTSYAGEGVPELAPWKSGADLLSHLQSPPRLLPAPQRAYIRLIAELKAAFPDGRVDWTAPPTNAVVNYVSHALRHDLPSIRPHDAAVIWKKWRDLVVAFRYHRTATDSVAFADRLEQVILDLITAVANPGEVWSSFCPWRAKYFDPKHGPQSQWEIDSWLP